MAGRSRTPRPRAHEIDTLAMRKVAQLLPAAWVERRVASDYGVDLEVELFDAGNSSGDLLLLQVKGLERTPSADEAWGFSMKTNGLIYAERFVVPVLLVICPTGSADSGFRYVWLQEYISVVLDPSKPGWRSQGSVTLSVPSENQMPSPPGEQHLAHVAAHPRRQRELAHLARLAHELQYESGIWLEFPEEQHLRRINELIDEALGLDSLFGPKGWQWSRTLADVNLRGPALLAKKLLAHEPVTAEDVPGISIPEELRSDSLELLAVVVRHRIASFGNAIGAMISTAGDTNLRRTSWERNGSHWF